MAGGGVNQQALTGVVVKAADFGDELCESPFAAGTFDNLTNSNGDPYLDGQGQAAKIMYMRYIGSALSIHMTFIVAIMSMKGEIAMSVTMARLVTPRPGTAANWVLMIVTSLSFSHQQPLTEPLMGTLTLMMFRR